MKKWMKMAAFGLAACMMLSGCASKGEAEKKVYKIGIAQTIEHNALSAARKGFVDKLNELGLKFEEDFQNAQADQGNLKAIAQRFVTNEDELILAIATPALQAMANETKTIPILGTAVTDYPALKLVESNEKPGSNVSGTSDMNPVEEQIKLIKEICPNVETIGLIYTASEANSSLQADIARKTIEAQGLQYEEATVTAAADIQQAAQSLIDKVDAVYVPTDNIVASAMPSLIGITQSSKIPVFGGEAGQVENGATMTYGVDYYTLGQQTGEMAYRILVEGASVADMPVEVSKTYQYAYNAKSIAELGIELPEEIKANAIVFE